MALVTCSSQMTQYALPLHSFIDFEYSGVTYLIGVGTYDATIFIVKLDGDGGGDVAGYSYSRTVVDYTGSGVSTRTMSGFGSG